MSNKTKPRQPYTVIYFPLWLEWVQLGGQKPKSIRHADLWISNKLLREINPIDFIRGVAFTTQGPIILQPDTKIRVIPRSMSLIAKASAAFIEAQKPEPARQVVSTFNILNDGTFERRVWDEETCAWLVQEYNPNKADTQMYYEEG